MNLKEQRQRIDDIDSEIVRLINERLEVVKSIGELKSHQQTDYYVPSREQEVYRRLFAQNKGLLTEKALKAIYCEIMSASLALEHDLLIAYLGTEGTHTYEAAKKKFGSSVQYSGLKTIRDIFEDVSHKRVDYGVVPVENSTEGAVTDTLDMLMDYDLKVYAETSLDIQHCLMSKNKDESIEKIYSHPQALGQCRDWLRKHYPNAALVHTDSTTAAVEIAKKEPRAAAIAGKNAAQVYNLDILASAIQDHEHNITRFLVIGHDFNQRTGHDKTSVLFSLKDKVGALSDALKHFRDHRINLSRIESRPFKKEIWKYIFFVDMDGHMEDKRIKEALDELKKKCQFLKILGSYPVEV